MLLSMRCRSWALTRHRGGDECSDLLHRFDQMRIAKVGVARHGTMAVMLEEPAEGERQTPERHSGHHRPLDHPIGNYGFAQTRHKAGQAERLLRQAKLWRGGCHELKPLFAIQRIRPRPAKAQPASRKRVLHGVRQRPS